MDNRGKIACRRVVFVFVEWRGGEMERVDRHRMMVGTWREQGGSGCLGGLW